MPFLEMTKYDLAVTAFIYLNLGKTSIRDVASGAGTIWTLVQWVDGLTHFILIWMLMLMIAGASLARRGEPMRWSDLFIAATLSIAAQSVFASMRGGVFSAIQIATAVAGVIGTVILSALPFVLVVFVLNRWAVAILGRREGDARERLVWSALLIAAAFTVPEALYSVGGSAFFHSVANPQLMETVGGGSTQEMVMTMLPMFALVLALWTSRLVAAAAIAIWSLKRARSIPDVHCPSCGITFFPRKARYPIALACPRCDSILRNDLLEILGPAGATA
jgi:hypothetical protein